MNNEELYEQWRADRSRVEPPAGFADRVMHRIAGESAVSATHSSPPRGNGLVRFALCAAAGIAVLVRAFEILSLFSTTAVGN